MRDNTKRYYVDDWGISPGVNQATVWLIQNRLVKGVSLISNSRFFSCGLEELLLSDVLLGCHLNFTSHDIFPFKFFGINKILFVKVIYLNLKALFFKTRVKNEIERQVLWLKEKTLKLDYIDGHHHIHLYPFLLPLVKEVANKYQLKIRIISDKDFMLLSFLSLVAKLNLKNKSIFKVGYLSYKYPTLKKINTSGSDLVVHPSVEDDFQYYCVQDSLSKQRVEQFSIIKRAHFEFTRTLEK